MARIARFVGMDVHAETIAVAIAEGRSAPRSLGTIPNRPEAIRHCDVIAPSLVPKMPGDRIRTDRRHVCCNGLVLCLRRSNREERVPRDRAQAARSAANVKGSVASRVTRRAVPNPTSPSSAGSDSGPLVTSGTQH